MHSSRMCTGHSLTVCRSLLLGGSPSWGSPSWGVSILGCSSFFGGFLLGGFSLLGGSPSWGVLLLGGSSFFGGLLLGGVPPSEGSPSWGGLPLGGLLLGVDSYKCPCRFFKVLNISLACRVPWDITNGNRSHNKPLELI